MRKKPVEEDNTDNINTNKRLIWKRKIDSKGKQVHSVTIKEREEGKLELHR